MLVIGILRHYQSEQQIYGGVVRGVIVDCVFQSQKYACGSLAVFQTTMGNSDTLAESRGSKFLTGQQRV